MKRNLLIAELSSATLILLFGYTAISKAAHTSAFRHALAESPVAQNGAAVAAWLIILAEAAIILLLFFPATRRTGLYLSLGALSVFTLYLIYMVLFAAKLPCGCGGVISKLSWRQHIFFNLFFLLINVVGIWQWRKVYPVWKRDKVFYDTISRKEAKEG